MWRDFCAATADRKTAPGSALHSLGADRQCCRRMLLSVVELNTLFADHEVAHEALDKIKVERTAQQQRVVSCDGTMM